MALQLPESKPLKTSEELELTKALDGTKIADSTFDEFKGTLKFCIMLVGLRAANFPVDEEKEFLYEYAKNRFGNHTLAEMRMAFDLAIRRKLDLERDEIKCYENFSVDYFANIMVAFRRWSGKAKEQLDRSYVQPLQLLSYTNQQIHWQAFIETEYQEYLQQGDKRKGTYPAEFYDQLVKDMFIQDTAYTDDIAVAKRIVLSDLQKQIAVLQMRQVPDSERDKLLNDINKLKEMAEEYRNDKYEAAINLMAKQETIIRLFRMAKHRNLPNIYIPENKTEE